MIRILFTFIFSWSLLHATSYKDFSKDHLFTDLLHTAKTLPQYGVYKLSYRFHYTESVVVSGQNNTLYNGENPYFPKAWTGAKIYFPKGLTKASFAMITKPNTNMLVHMTFVGDNQTSDGVIDHFNAHRDSSKIMQGTYEKRYANGSTITLDADDITSKGGGWLYIDLMKNENDPKINSVNPNGSARVDITQNIGFTEATFTPMDNWIANTNFITKKQSPITPYKELKIINDQTASNQASSPVYLSLPTGTQRYGNMDDLLAQVDTTISTTTNTGTSGSTGTTTPTCPLGEVYSYSEYKCISSISTTTTEGAWTFDGVYASVENFFLALANIYDGGIDGATTSISEYLSNLGNEFLDDPIQFVKDSYSTSENFVVGVYDGSVELYHGGVSMYDTAIALYEEYALWLENLYNDISSYTISFLDDNSTQVEVTTTVPNDGINF